MGYGFGGCGKGCGFGDDNGILFILLIIILFACCDGGFGGIGKGCGDDGLIWIIVIIVLLCLCNPGFGGLLGMGNPQADSTEIGE